MTVSTTGKSLQTLRLEELFVLQGAYIRTKIRWEIVAWFGKGGKQGKVRVEMSRE